MHTLRFITCGSVDDGKSTLIGRLLFESHNIFEDQFSALQRDSLQYGTQGQRPDLALLVDGLQAEREQGITIDVAYRFFSTESRRFIVADTPGHEQYTRNMATGASTADAAIILVDARKGLLTQTLRHSRIVALMGVRHVVLAVNKMDLTGFSSSVFEAIEAAYRQFAQDLKFDSLQAIPLSGLEGDNVVMRSPTMPWYNGPALLEYLNGLDAQPPEMTSAFRMPVQLVNRPSPDFRGYCGRVASGRVRTGDTLLAMPSGVQAKVRRILDGFADVAEAQVGDSVTLQLDREIDTSRGDVLAAADSPPDVADQFEAHLIWTSAQTLVPGRQYLLKLATREVTATVTAIKHLQDVNTGAHLAAKSLSMNEIAVVCLSVSAPLVFEPYARNRTLGGLILIDKFSFETVAVGMLDFALRRAHNVHWQMMEVNQAARSALKHHAPRCIWLTGLSGSGKSTVANLLEKHLYAQGQHTYLLDGDNLRHGLNRNLGFTEADRVENIRRVAEVARLMVDAGLVVIVSLISPYRGERQMARSLFPAEPPGEFVEVFVEAALDVCEQRDPKGLYAKARRGELKHFTGIDSPYEPPLAPELRLNTAHLDPQACVDSILAYLRATDA